MEKFKIKKEDAVQLIGGSTGIIIGFNKLTNEIIVNHNFRNDNYKTQMIKKINGILVEKESFEYVLSKDEIEEIKERIKENSVVQVTDTESEYSGCLIYVEEVKNWGICGFIKVKSGVSYLRLKFEEIEYIGEAILIIKK